MVSKSTRVDIHLRECRKYNSFSNCSPSVLQFFLLPHAIFREKEKEGGKMYCYDEQHQLIGVISCFPKAGEEHAWGDDLYLCTGNQTTGLGCRNGIIFKKSRKKVMRCLD